MTNNHGAATNVRSGDQRHAIHTPTGLDWFLARDCLDNRFGDDWLTARRRFRIGAASLEFGEIQDAASRRSARVLPGGKAVKAASSIWVSKSATSALLVGLAIHSSFSGKRAGKDDHNRSRYADINSTDIPTCADFLARSA